MQRDTSVTGNHVHWEASGCLLKGKKIIHHKIKMDNSYFLWNIAVFIVTCQFFFFFIFVIFKSKTLTSPPPRNKIYFLITIQPLQSEISN